MTAIHPVVNEPGRRLSRKRHFLKLDNTPSRTSCLLAPASSGLKAKMFTLLLKLVGPLVFLVASLVRLGLENRWRDRRSRQRQMVLRFLVAAMFIGTALTVIYIITDHREREAAALQVNDRARQAQEERRQISTSIAELVELARERAPDLTEQQALSEISAEVRSLRQQTVQLETELDGVKKYSSVSKLNAQGLTGRAGAGLRETSDLSRALDGAYIEHGGKLYPNCNTEGIAQFARVTVEYPSFPFAHYALAVCQRQEGNPEWQQHAQRAIDILYHTTRLDGHHQNHDDAYRELQNLVE